MIRIGIIGTESKHSEFFAGVLSSGAFPDACCVGICCKDRPERADYVRRHSGADRFFASEEELIGASDAVMICYRDGGKHAACARMCAAAGRPFFVDKPFGVTPADAEEIVGAAEDSGVPMMGGSTLVFDPQIGPARRAMSKACGLWVSYAADPGSPYHGYHFYGSHLMDIALSVDGRVPLSVRAVGHCGAVTAVLNGQDGVQTVLQSNPKFVVPAVAVLSENGLETFRLDDSACYSNGLAAFIGMVRSGKPPVPYGRYLLSVKLVGAVVESMDSEKTVFLS